MKIGKKYAKGGEMKEMYASGGMMAALLQDPKQREIAKEMLMEYGGMMPEKESMMAKGGMMSEDEYEDGGAIDPQRELMMLTANYMREGLRQAGVGGKYSIDESGKDMAMSDSDYSDLVKMSKSKDVYDEARSKAVADFRKKYGDK
jgi:hypothetical protein